jgi:hypothetical protein
MSNKTMKQRIAVVAVSALTAGILSVMSAPVANAAGGDLSASIVYGNRGILANAGIGTTASPSTTTGVITTGGYVTYLLDVGGAETYVMVTVSGGTVESLGLGTIAQSGTAFYIATAGATDVDLRFKPNTAGTNMVIKTYDTADLIASAAEGKAQVNFNVVAPGLGGVIAPANTRATLVNTGDSTATGTSDTLYANTASNGNEARINVKLYDGLGSAYTSSNGLVTFTVKSGDCLVGDSGSQTLKFYAPTATSGVASAYTVQATDDAPTSCVIEVGVEGVAVATKTITHQGPVKTITVSDVEIADAGGSAQTGLATVRAYDSANNSIGYLLLTEGTGTNGSVNTLTGNNSFRTSSGDTSVNSGAAPASSASTIGWTCSGVRGSASMTVKHTPSNGVAVHSNTFTAACNGDAVNYSASLDKASYVPGDIATLTITATDASKNAANDQEVIGTNGTKDVAIAGSNMTAITAPTNADTFTSGKKTYKYIVGSSEGSYQMSVDLPKFNSTTYSQSAVTVAYKIAASTATVSNADVLKSIVSLIASINKQIQALQKLILKR